MSPLGGRFGDLLVAGAALFGDVCFLLSAGGISGWRCDEPVGEMIDSSDGDTAELVEQTSLKCQLTGQVWILLAGHCDLRFPVQH